MFEILVVIAFVFLMVKFLGLAFKIAWGLAGLSQILCKHRNAVQIEQNLFKAEVAQAAAALFSK